MGSGISPIGVEFAMSYVLTKVIERVKATFDNDLELNVYVDAIWTTIPDGMEDAILSIFNSVNTHIQFTCLRLSACCHSWMFWSSEIQRAASSRLNGIENRWHQIDS